MRDQYHRGSSRRNSKFSAVIKLNLQHLAWESLVQALKLSTTKCPSKLLSQETEMTTPSWTRIFLAIRFL
jgi:hypothetical protein